MQHLVVLEVVQQRIGHCAWRCGQKYCSAFNPNRWTDKNRFQKTRQFNCIFTQLLVQNKATIFPRHHQGKNRARQQDGKPSTLNKLEHVGCQKQKVDQKENACGRDAHPQRVLPAKTHHIKRQNSSNQHVATHGYAISCGQCFGRSKENNCQHNCRKQRPVNKGDVDLPGFLDAGVCHLQTRQVAQLNDLFGGAKSA